MASNFVWSELMTSDIDAAETFYKEVAGWSAGLPDRTTGP